ncbi:MULTISPECIES: hypothetical protein [unclassified Streptomyces]|uniref:hypothetical protein n=1 Tax=unclassified Streptomyces TaxID=2593676 RepID=UPI003450BE73
MTAGGRRCGGAPATSGSQVGCGALGRLVAEGGSHAIEGLGDLLGPALGLRELLGDIVGEPVPLGLVLVALENLGGVAQLLGDLPQDCGLLLRGGRGVGGLQERVQSCGQGAGIGGEAVEGGVQRLGVGGHGPTAGAVVVLGRRQPADAEADGHVTGSGAGAELIGEGTGEIVHGRRVGDRGDSQGGW